MEEKYSLGVGWHPVWCKWWLRTRQISGDPHSPGGALCEFYVPLWAWPLELLHRALFGRDTLNLKPEAGEE